MFYITVLASYARTFIKIFYKILSCSGKRSTYGASDDQNELDDFVGLSLQLRNLLKILKKIPR